MSLLRRYKISLIDDIPLSNQDNEIIDFITSEISSLSKIKTMNDSNIVYKNYDGKIECILEYSKKSKAVYYINGVLQDLNYNYDIPPSDINSLIKYFASKILKIEVDVVYLLF